VTTLSEARSQAEHTTAMPTRPSRRPAKRISDGKSGLRHFSAAHDGGVIELVVRQERVVRAAARGALVVDAIDGRMLGAGEARDADELRQRDAVAPLAVRVARGAAHAVLGSQMIVHRSTLHPVADAAKPPMCTMAR
jgi:hypothetical protein